MEYSPRHTSDGALREDTRGVERLMSVVVPTCNESENVDTTYKALTEIAAKSSESNWEFVFVEDGSTDDTFERLRALHRVDPRVKIVRLSRNFGFHLAIAAGLQFASGDAVAIMAADLQDHPREILRFLEKWYEGYQVVLGVRASRKDRWSDRVLAGFFAALIRRIGLPDFPATGTGSFCLLDRMVVDVLNNYREHNRITLGLILLSGFRRAEVPYDRSERRIGHSKFTFRRKFLVMLDAVFSFSTVPIRCASLCGILFAVVGLIYAVYLVLLRMVSGHVAEGWTSIIVAMLVIGGLQLFVLGILGEYLWRTVDEVRARPLYIIRELTGHFASLEKNRTGNPPVPSIRAVF
jgi:dolichol-phosphate mannosyltransferase